MNKSPEREHGGIMKFVLFLTVHAVFVRRRQWVTPVVRFSVAFRRRLFKRTRRLAPKLWVSLQPLCSLRLFGCWWAACLGLHLLLTTCCVGASASPSLSGWLFCLSSQLCRLYLESLLVSADSTCGLFSRSLRWAWCLFVMHNVFRRVAYKIKVLCILCYWLFIDINCTTFWNKYPTSKLLQYYIRTLWVTILNKIVIAVLISQILYI